MPGISGHFWVGGGERKDAPVRSQCIRTDGKTHSVWARISHLERHGGRVRSEIALVVVHVAEVVTRPGGNGIVAADDTVQRGRGHGRLPGKMGWSETVNERKETGRR